MAKKIANLVLVLELVCLALQHQIRKRVHNIIVYEKFFSSIGSDHFCCIKSSR